MDVCFGCTGAIDLRTGGAIRVDGRGSGSVSCAGSGTCLEMRGPLGVLRDAR
jgi:hypothetical protein